MPGVSSPTLARRLGPWSSIGLVIGVTIGSGIFRTPAVIAERVPDPLLMLGIWLVGGLISLCGALSVAELASRVPETGGWYVYLREAWGRLAGFLFGWAELVLIRASAVGAIATVFSEYALRVSGRNPGAQAALTDWLAAGAIVIAAALNIRGVQLGAAIVGLSTAAKVSALLLIVGLSFALGAESGGAAHFTAPGGPVDPRLAGLALISVLWAYDGFADVSFASGEVTSPQRTLPRAIIAGTLAIVAIYLLANAAYLYVAPVGSIAGSRLIAADTMEAVMGPGGRTAVAAAVAISAFGALVATMLMSPRVFFAMAADGLFFRRVAAVHPAYGTPYVAIGLAAALGVVFVLTRTFEQLADTFVLSIWPFYGLAVAGLFRLRRRPGSPSGYRVPGYPVLPLAFIAAVVYLVGNALVADFIWTGVTFGIVALGIPVYYAAFAGRADRASTWIDPVIRSASTREKDRRGGRLRGGRKQKALKHRVFHAQSRRRQGTSRRRIACWVKGLEADTSMTGRSLGWAVVPVFVAVALAGLAQPASAAGTLIHQYRLNEFTGQTDDFGGPSLLPIVAADPDGAGALGVPGAVALGSADAVPALGLAATPGCVAGAPDTLPRQCQGYAFGFSQGLTLERGPGTANEDAEHYLIVVEMLISHGGGRRRILDF